MQGMAGAGLVGVPGAAFQPGAAVAPATQVELTVSCKNLRDMDVFSKSDPLCVLYVKEFGQDRYREFGRTETVMNTLNPKFVRKFVMDYYFEEQQKLRFDLYDKDSDEHTLDRDDFLGSLECTLGEIVGAPGSRFERKLRGASATGDYGSITIQSEELSNCKEIMLLHMRANKLDKKDFFGKSDPFLVFHRCNEDGSWTIVHQTEVIKNTLDPDWRPFSLKLRALCNGDHDRQILVECFDWNLSGSHDMIGVFQTNVRTLRKGACQENIYPVIDAKKKAKKKNYKNSGNVTVLSAKLETEYSFLDYVQGGLQIHFTVAIDFTASNGNPMSPQSLHYINPHHPNQYLTAIQSVGEIIQDYDCTKMFPALGFGARLPPDGRVSHEFYLNLHPSNPQCNGIGGVLAAYNSAIRAVQLYGPTNFSPVINHVARIAAGQRSGSDYYILLIITDGVITDMDQTKQAVIAASRLPMSIIIVGVGDADFDAMDELDSDDRLLRYYNQVAERDIVQFVPMRDFNHSRASYLQKAHLAKEVLAEVPDQVVGYLKKMKVKPGDFPDTRGSLPQGERFNPDGPVPATAPPVIGATQGVPMNVNVGGGAYPQPSPPPPYHHAMPGGVGPPPHGYQEAAQGFPQGPPPGYGQPSAPAPGGYPQYGGYPSQHASGYGAPGPYPSSHQQR